MITGNITVAFTVLSYAGMLTVTVIADPEQCLDYQAIGAAVQRELNMLVGAWTRTS